MLRNNFGKIFIIRSSGSTTEVPIRKNSIYLGRSHENWSPDLDFGKLCNDFKVSRRHAHLYFKDGHWWIEDLGSRHGTLVDGEEIKGLKSPTRLPSGVKVKMGESVWWIDPPNLFRRYYEDLIIEYEKISAVNFAIYQCGIPIISNFIIRNISLSKSPPIRIEIYIPGYSNYWRKSLEPLPPQEEVLLNKIQIPLHYEKLEGRESRVNAKLVIKINDQTIANDQMPILGFYHWPLDLPFRKTITCFIQPSHPIVQHLVLEALFYLKHISPFSSFTHLLFSEREDKADIAMKSIYEALKEKYDIQYCGESPGSDGQEPISQEIRPPHKVILRRSDAENQRGLGEGTCIDLTLLYASCIENIRFQPLILFFRNNHNQHSLLGCWKGITERFVPIIEDYKKLREALDNNKIILIETTGFTDRWGEKLSFEEAIKKAYKYFDQNQFLFAIDIAAARQTIPPLQFPMSPKVTEIIRKAEELARREKGANNIETRHLIYSFLLEGSEWVKEILKNSGVNLFYIGRVIPEVRRENKINLKATINYRRCLEDARIIAEDDGKIFIEEEHLFYAVLLSQSKTVDFIFERLGTDRRTVMRVYHERFKIMVSETAYEPF